MKNTIKFWTLLHGPGNYVTSMETDHETSKNPRDAVKYKDIWVATEAANEFKRKHGVDVMVHIEELDYEDLAHQSFYSENL